ncbi:MAG: hypothetical protein GY801_26185 [bacterium]|nr:hypothetical protein [bacterium]
MNATRSTSADSLPEEDTTTPANASPEDEVETPTDASPEDETTAPANASPKDEADAPIDASPEDETTAPINASPEDENASSGPSPSAVQRGLPRILRQPGTPARPSKRRGNAPGRSAGEKLVLRVRVSVIKKVGTETHASETAAGSVILCSQFFKERICVNKISYEYARSLSKVQTN